MFHKFLMSFYYAFRGLRFIWKEERNFKVQLLLAAAVILAAWYLNLSYLEFALVLIVIILVLAAESLNTVLEDALNIVKPEQDPRVGAIKDMSAAIVLIISVGALVIGFLIFSKHL